MKNQPKKQNKESREEQRASTRETVDFVRTIINESRSIATEIVRNKHVPGAKLTPLSKSQLYC